MLSRRGFLKALASVPAVAVGLTVTPAPAPPAPPFWANAPIEATAWWDENPRFILVGHRSTRDAYHALLRVKAHTSSWRYLDGVSG